MVLGDVLGDPTDANDGAFGIDDRRAPQVDVATFAARHRKAMLELEGPTVARRLLERGRHVVAVGHVDARQVVIERATELERIDPEDVVVLL